MHATPPPLRSPTAPPAAAGSQPPTNPDALLVRGLGTRQLTATIFNYTVGSGIFALPAIVVAQLGGAAPLAYLLCALVMALVVLVFAEAGSRVTATGGPYAYVEAGLGPFVGFVTGMLILLADVAAAGAISALLAALTARLLGVGGPLWEGVIVTLLIVALATLNIRGVRTGARVVELSTVAKLVPLLAFVVVGSAFVSPHNLRWESVPSAGKVTATAGTLLFAFSGVESALLPSGEVRRPSRTVPRAAMLALGSVTVLYLAVQAVALGILGPALATDKVAPLAAAAATFAGSGGRALILAGATISMFGWLTGSLLAGPRGLFALGRDGFLPWQVAAVHARFRTPYVSIATYAALTLALALSGTFERLAVLSNIAVLGSYFLSAIAAWALRRRGVQGEGEPFRAPGGPLVPIMACVAIAWVVSQTITRREFAAVGAVLALSAVVYPLRARRAGARHAWATTDAS
jgi:basic amino acid/polyamine antiporter, APA family